MDKHSNVSLPHILIDDMVVNAGSEPVVDHFDVNFQFQLETMHGLLRAHDLESRLDWSMATTAMIRETVREGSVIPDQREAMIQWIVVPVIPAKAETDMFSNELKQEVFHAIRPKGIPFILESGGLKWGHATGQSGGVVGISTALQLHTALQYAVSYTHLTLPTSQLV